jgi:hypothetical protein
MLGEVIGQEKTVGYGNLFSAVFSDYRIFQRLFGILEINEATVSHLINLMELEDKNSYRGILLVSATRGKPSSSSHKTKGGRWRNDLSAGRSTSTSAHTHYRMEDGQIPLIPPAPRVSPA